MLIFKEFELDKKLIDQLRLVATYVNILNISVIAILSLGSVSVLSASIMFLHRKRVQKVI